MLRNSLISRALRPPSRSLSSVLFHTHPSPPSLLPATFQTTGLLLRTAPISRLRLSSFHSTPSREGGPWLYPILAVLKSSAAIEFARTAGRIALTFVPVLLVKNHKSRKYIQYAATHGSPASEEKKSILLKRIRNRTILFHILLLTPAVLFWAAIMASLERTPLTGRWRMIILAPEEEDEIAAQLAGPGWYQAVDDILSQEGPPQYVPTNDWRYVWVQNTLRKLERTIPILQKEREMEPRWLQRGPDDIPLPPPAEYPLRPRPRASEYLRWCHSLMSNQPVPPVRHVIPGPPYSLLLVEKPDASNAFSYGFGPDGAGGVVVYSGFLDDILSKMPPSGPEISPPPIRPWWSSLIGSLLPQSQPHPPHPIPTPEQTSELAILLAHELAHLVLSHHLETLSSGTIVVPGVLSIISDVVRVLVFPVTMLFGPFVNDAVAQLGKVSSSELVKVGEYCTSMKQEIEADVVSARLLAHAGYDARQAVSFWEDRQITPNTAECSSSKAEQLDPDRRDFLARRIMSAGHPANEIRVARLKDELVRWEIERRETLDRLDNEAQ